MAKNNFGFKEFTPNYDSKRTDFTPILITDTRNNKQYWFENYFFCSKTTKIPMHVFTDTFKKGMVKGEYNGFLFEKSRCIDKKKYNSRVQFYIDNK